MLEYRSAGFADIDLQGLNFRGYAAVFDTPWDEGLTETVGYQEKIARGAFRKALARTEDVPLLWMHDDKALLATRSAGTLKLSEDAKGLLVEASLPNTSLGNDVREHIARGEVRGMSYGMETRKEDSLTSKQGGRWTRTIANIRRLLDTTLTWQPAYTATTAELRSRGMVWTPLQEFVAGLEDQDDEAAGATSPSQTAGRRARARLLLIDELEREMMPHEGGRTQQAERAASGAGAGAAEPHHRR